MSTISLRLPDSLHDEVRKLAERDPISTNQLATLAIAEKVSALETRWKRRTTSANAPCGRTGKSSAAPWRK